MRRLRYVSGAARVILRLLFSLAGIAVLLFFVLGVFAHFQPASQEPSVTEAPWVIQTSSRIYYAREYKTENGVSAIRSYWEVNGSRYKFHDEVKEFPSSLYGKISVVRRSAQ